MNPDILKYFEMKLLWDCKRIMDESGKIKDIYIQPDRLNPESATYAGTLPDCLNWCDPTSASDSQSTTNK